MQEQTAAEKLGGTYSDRQRKFIHGEPSAARVFGPDFEASVASPEALTQPMPGMEVETQPVERVAQPAETAGSTPDLGSQTTGQKIGNFLRSVFT